MSCDRAKNSRRLQPGITKSPEFRQNTPDSDRNGLANSDPCLTETMPNRHKKFEHLTRMAVALLTLNPGRCVRLYEWLAGKWPIHFLELGCSLITDAQRRRSGRSLVQSRIPRSAHPFFRPGAYLKSLVMTQLR